MKVYGALESAQIEWFTEAGKPAASNYPFRVIYVTDLKQIQVSDGTNWNPSALYTYTAATLPAASSSNQYHIAFITDTLQVKVSNGTEWKTIGARLDTYTSGTIPAAASNANSIIWISDLQQVQVSNGTAWVQVGSKAGTKNYFSQNNANSDFETNSISPWSACTLTFSSGIPSGSPTLSATQMSIATTSTTPLSGTYSMQLTKATANAQYQGFISGALTIDRQDTAKVFYGSFNYEVTSGTVDFSGTSTQSLEIWVYNTVSGAWTQPAGYRGMNQSSGVGRVVFSFQTDGTFANNSYRIAVITQQTSASAYVVKFDDFQVGPQSIVLGTPATDWQIYTPTLSAGFGSVTNTSFRYRRIGDTLEVKGTFTTGVVAASLGTISLPSGLSIDTTKTSLNNLAANNSPNVGMFNQSAANQSGPVVTATASSTTQVYTGGQFAGSVTLVPANVNSTMSSSAVTSITFTVPIQGWSSNVQTSADTDTRVVAALIQANAANQSLTTGTAISWGGGAIFDTHGAYNGTTTYTIPVSGYYELKLAEIFCSGTNYFYVYKNGAQLNTTGTIAYFNTATYAGITNGSIIDKFNAGDTITIVSANSITLNYSATNYRAKWSIQRISGPSVITATETVAASYYATANAAANTSTPINFAGKLQDTHGSVTTGASWKFTAPVSGTYLVSGTVVQSSAGTSANTYFYKNGIQYMGLWSTSSNTYNINAPFSVLIYLNASEYIDVRNDAGTTLGGALTNSGNSKIHIIRVGN